MALQPDPALDPLAAWWQGLVSDPASTQQIASTEGIPAPSPIVTPDPMAPPEIEMPPQNARPEIGFPRVPEPLPEIEMPAMDARSGLPAPVESALGGLQPGLGVPTGAVDALQPPTVDSISGADTASPLVAQNMARNDREAGSEQLAEFPEAFGADSLYENELQRRSTLSNAEAMAEDRLQAAQEKSDDEQRLLALYEQGEQDRKNEQTVRDEARRARAQERQAIDQKRQELLEQGAGAGDWYEEGGVGRTVTAMLMGLAGGLVQHLNGGRNVGLEAVNQSINRFIAAKQADRDHQRAVLGERERSLAQRWADEDEDAREATALREASLERMKSQIMTFAQSYDPESARARAADNIVRQIEAEQIAGHLSAEEAAEKKWQARIKFQLDSAKTLADIKKTGADIAKLEADAAKARMAGMGGGAKPPKPEDLVQPPEYYAQRGLVAPPVPMSEKQYRSWQPQKKASQEIEANRNVSGMSKEERENWVPGVFNDADGKVPFIAAGRPEDVSKLKSQIEGAERAISALDDILRTRTGWSSDALNSDEKQKLEVMQRDAEAAIKALEDLGAIQEADKPYLSGLIGIKNASGWNEINAGVLEARRRIENNVNRKLKSAGRSDAAPRWEIKAPSTKKPEKSIDDYRLERAQGKGVDDVSSYTSFAIGMQGDAVPRDQKATNAEVKAAYQRGGLPPDIQSDIDRWAAEARAGNEQSWAYLASLVQTGGNDAVNAAAQNALNSLAVSLPERVGPVRSAHAQDTIAAPPPPKKKGGR